MVNWIIGYFILSWVLCVLVYLTCTPEERAKLNTTAKIFMAFFMPIVLVYFIVWKIYKIPARRRGRIDRKLAKIGFNKVGENEYGAYYVRFNEHLKYLHRLELVRKQNGVYILQSYESGVSVHSPDTVVGLTMYETRLALKKMKQMGWKEVK